RGTLLPGEDLELCFALVLAGYRTWYDEHLHVTHFMPKGRLTLDHLFELKRRNRMAGPMQAGYEIALRSDGIGAFGYYARRVLLRAFWLLKGALKFLLRRESWLSVRIAFSDWFRSLFDYFALRRVLRAHLAEILQLRYKSPASE